MASRRPASGAGENWHRTTIVSHMSHRCRICAQDAILGPLPGTKCLSQARRTSHRAELSTGVILDLESFPVTFAAQKQPPHPPFHTNNLKAQKCWCEVHVLIRCLSGTLKHKSAGSVVNSGGEGRAAQEKQGLLIHSPVAGLGVLYGSLRPRNGCLQMTRCYSQTTDT